MTPSSFSKLLQVQSKTRFNCLENLQNNLRGQKLCYMLHSRFLSRVFVRSTLRNDTCRGKEGSRMRPWEKLDCNAFMTRPLAHRELWGWEGPVHVLSGEPDLYTPEFISHWIWAVLGSRHPLARWCSSVEAILKEGWGDLSADNPPRNQGNIDPSVLK